MTADINPHKHLFQFCHFTQKTVTTPRCQKNTVPPVMGVMMMLKLRLDQGRDLGGGAPCSGGPGMGGERGMGVREKAGRRWGHWNTGLQLLPVLFGLLKLVQPVEESLDDVITSDWSPETQEGDLSWAADILMVTYKWHIKPLTHILSLLSRSGWALWKWAEWWPIRLLICVTASVTHWDLTLDHTEQEI